MLQTIISGGWLMIPIIFCSVAALAICIERFVVLQPAKIAPPHLLAQVWTWIKNEQIDTAHLRQLRLSSPLGRILATGLSNARHGRDVMKESIEETASHVVHELERYLDVLGTIGMVSPLLGLLGTVFGMIQVFSQIVLQGTGNPAVLAGGIAQALITTAAGLIVAIPTVVMHSYYQRKVDSIVVGMEMETIKLVDAMHGERKVEIK